MERTPPNVDDRVFGYSAFVLGIVAAPWRGSAGKASLIAPSRRRCRRSNAQATDRRHSPLLTGVKDMRDILTIVIFKSDPRSPSSGDGTRPQWKTFASIHHIAMGCGTVG